MPLMESKIATFSRVFTGQLAVIGGFQALSGEFQPIVHERHPCPLTFQWPDFLERTGTFIFPEVSNVVARYQENQI